MNAGETIYVVTYGSIDDEDHFIGAYARHYDAITACTSAAADAADDVNKNDDGEWVAATDLETYAILRRASLVEGNEPIDMCWWNIQEAILK